MLLLKVVSPAFPENQLPFVFYESLWLLLSWIIVPVVEFVLLFARTLP